MDHEKLHPEAAEPISPPDGPAHLGKIVPRKRDGVKGKKFRDKFVLSIDGERYDPGHGIVCEVHQGLACVIGDGKARSYRPSSLLEGKDRAKEMEMRDVPRKVEDWLKIMERQHERTSEDSSLPVDTASVVEDPFKSPATEKFLESPTEEQDNEAVLPSDII
jgi:hypothetical protein